MRILDTVRNDLEEDRRLAYLLAVSALTMGFWFWWRSPNFATADEYGRLLRPMKAGGYFVADPSFDSFVRGATDGVPQGATFYLYALLLVPVFLLVLLTGNLDEFGSFAAYESRWDLWFAVPDWYWEASVGTVRFANVLVGIASVYALYRIGTAAWNRRAGFYGGLTLALTLAFVGSAHEADEDTAMVLALLVTTYLALRYVQTGHDRYALWGAFAGGVAIAFKLTGGPAVFVLGAGLVTRELDQTTGGPVELFSSIRERGRLIASMLAIGLVTIYVGRPNVLFGGPGELLFRTTWATDAYFAESSPPPGFPQFRALFQATGLPLALALLVGLGWHLARLLRRRTDGCVPMILLPAIVPYVVVFSWWNSFRPHHVLPAVALGIVLLTPLLERGLRADRSRATRALVAGLLLTTAIFAGAGTLSLASDPRDQATGWVDDNVEDDERVLVYDASVASYGITHDTSVERYDWVEEPGVSDQIRNYTAYTEWVTASVDREPEYIMITDAPPVYSEPGRGADSNVTRQSAFYDRLLDGDHFGYEVAAKFGELPAERGYARQLLRAGVAPSVEKRSERVIVLRHPDVDGADEETG